MILQKEDYKSVTQSLQNTILDLCKITLLLELMNVCIIADLDFELAFTKIRYSLLSSIYEISATSEVLLFQSVFLQKCLCHLN